MSEPFRFTVPSGWTVEECPGAVTVVGPESDLRIAFVELDAAGSIQETALSAWRIIDPAFAGKVRREVAVPPPEGWDEMHQINYEVPANEARMELAVVRRLGGRAFVNLVRGTTAGLSRRGAQLGEAVGSWKPEGLKEVSLKDRAAAQWNPELSEKLRQFLISAMAEIQIPGAAIAVVQGGTVVYTEGFGTGRIGEDAPVGPKTKFMIGSTTKALTSLLMAKLVDLGKLSWSTPVIDLLPGFTLADEDVTRRLEMRHTVSASTGMPRQDTEFVFRYKGITPEDRMAEMKTMRPTTGFGETFQYSNLLVAAGGYAAARAFTPEGSLEPAFEIAIEDLVFRPLGMNDTVLRRQQALEGDAAMPHAKNFEGGVSGISIDLETAVYSVAPAGGAWSTVVDMARYLLLELGKGRMPEGGQILSEAALLERRKKGIKIDQDSSYGLGLIVSDYSGVQIVHHGGNTLGFSSDMYFLPEKDLGVALLTNRYASNVFLGAAREKIFELVFGAESRAEKTVASVVKLTEDGLALLRQKVTTDADAMGWVGDLMGRYDCTELGPAQISRRSEGYWIQFREWGSVLGSEIQEGGDRLVRLLSPPWTGTLRMLVDPAGNELRLDGGQNKYIFRRRDA